MRQVILYLRGDKMFPQWESMPSDKQSLALTGFGDSCEGKALLLGGIEVAKVTGFRTTPTAVGLIVEWSEWIEQGQIITKTKERDNGESTERA